MAKSTTPSTGISAKDLLKTMQKDHGEAIGSLGGKLVDSTRIPSGLFAFDLATCGGIPRGRCSIIYGPESSGKTNLVLLTIANHQRLWPDQTCVFFDLENSFDPEWAAKLGVKTEELIVVKPEYAEKVVDMAESFLLADDCGIVAIDSLAALVTTSEGEASAERANVGGTGLVCGKLVRKTTLAMSRAEQAGRTPTLIYINQTRFKIGVMFGDPETMPGGNAPKFQANLWIRLYGKNITDPKVSKTMPVRKETTFVIKKNKVPILSGSGKFEMVTFPYNGLQPGDSVDWSLLKQYLTDYECLAKGEKGGWDMLGEKYPTQEACRDRLYSDKVYGMEVRQALIDRIVADGGALIGDLE